jgi:tRNA threonylcarbamoyladenosine biosynthesis protein TsaB
MATAPGIVPLVPPVRSGLLLALETSTPTARVAIVSDDRVLAATEKTAARHSSTLLGLVDDALASAGVRLADLAAIACGAGPGSFTGLRVGLSVAKGLALPTGLPLVLTSSLEALAGDLGGLPGTLVVPCLDAGKGQVYARLYRVETSGALALAGDPSGAFSKTPEWVLDPEDLAQRVVTMPGPWLAGGTGIDRYLALFCARFGDASTRAQVPGPSALAVARLAQARLARGETDDLAAAVPSYGRPPDITRPKRL